MKWHLFLVLNMKGIFISIFEKLILIFTVTQFQNKKVRKLSSCQFNKKCCFDYKKIKSFFNIKKKLKE